MHQAQLVRSKGFLTCCVYYTRNLLNELSVNIMLIGKFQRKKANYGQSSGENLTPATYSQVRQRKMAIIYFSTPVLLIK